jgi:hypothetical protein
MVERVVSALSSFRRAASESNGNVRRILRDLLPTTRQGEEYSRELEETVNVSLKNDEATKNESNKVAGLSEENSNIAEEIARELKNLGKNFKNLLVGEDGFGGLLAAGGLGLLGGLALGGLSLNFSGDEDEEDITGSLSGEREGAGINYENYEPISDLDISQINFASGAVISPSDERAHVESRRFASPENVQDTLEKFVNLQNVFGARLTINDFIPRSGTTRRTPSSGGGSEHWNGRALDISTSNMNHNDKIRLVSSALEAGFTGFGFGNTILHVDTGRRRYWGYGNSTFGEIPLSELGAWVTGRGAQPERVREVLEATPLNQGFQTQIEPDGAEDEPDNGQPEVAPPVFEEGLTESGSIEPASSATEAPPSFLEQSGEELIPSSSVDEQPEQPSPEFEPQTFHPEEVIQSSFGVEDDVPRQLDILSQDRLGDGSFETTPMYSANLQIYQTSFTTTADAETPKPSTQIEAEYPTNTQSRQPSHHTATFDSRWIESANGGRTTERKPLWELT